MLEKLKLTLGIQGDTQDEVLALLLEDATSEVLDLTNHQVVDNEIERIARALAAVMFTKRRSNGLASESYGGVSQAFTDGYPKEILSMIHRKRRLPGARR